MKGDFSRWNVDEDKKENYNGVLHQQGRVLTDNDWNAGTRLLNAWQQQNGRDVIGPGVAAVPAEVPESFKVQNAQIRTDSDPEKVVLKIHTGRVWSDGLLTYLTGSDPIERVATYIETTSQPVDREAVILEVWREAINGFQMPDLLLEPALGGPDTTERVHTAIAFRLLKLGERDNCENIRDKLKDNPSKMGTLKVSLQPAVTISGECPVEEGGGYTGFEHFLYRIEIAKVSDAKFTENGSMFKWSRFNGGLVGRGISKNGKIEITHNYQAITTSSLVSFYLETVEYDENLGHWRVAYGAKVTLNSDNQLDLPTLTDTFFGSEPTANETVFFRLWDGIEQISNFPPPDPGASPIELIDGILLEFEQDSNKYFRPGDFWTFEVRVGGGNQGVLIDNQPSEGIQYHRVPLAIINWKNNKKAAIIDDCRRIFQPLANQEGCCTFLVGDGKTSHGDFDSLEDAIKHLPETGGDICLLPGFHETNTKIKERQNIRIRGCHPKTQVVPRETGINVPIFEVIDSQNIIMESLFLTAPGSIAIDLKETEIEGSELREVEICNNDIAALVHAVHVANGRKINIHNNIIRMIDLKESDVAIKILADDSIIERNEITITPGRDYFKSSKIPGIDRLPPPFNLNVENNDLYGDLTLFNTFNQLLRTRSNDIFRRTAIITPGGIQIIGGCDGIKILENQIIGGSGNGLTLGSKPVVSESEDQYTDLSGTIKIKTYPALNTSITINILLERILIETRESKKLIQVETDNQGQCEFSFSKVSPGKYRIFVRIVESEGSSYNIEEINIEVGKNFKVSNFEDENPSYTFDISANEEIPEGFIYDVLIEGNEISYMGLSGIGVKWVRPDVSTLFPSMLHSARSNIFVSDWVENLTIRHNHIYNCLKNPYEKIKEEVKNKGLGGISLGLCEAVSIFGNRIENNGESNESSHIYPVCGIYIYRGNIIDISHNIIVNNGPIKENSKVLLLDGIRGGIFIHNTTSTPILSKESQFLMGRPAAKIHDNVVDQPIGRALTFTGNGALSILNNQFNSELSGTENEKFKVGSVKIINGRVVTTQTTAPSNAKKINSKQVTQTYSGVYLEEANMIEQIPKGNILFNNNQTRMGLDNKSHISQVIFSDNDIGFEGNQSDALGKINEVDLNIDNILIEKRNLTTTSLAINTILKANTLRATGNRFKKVIYSKPDLSVGIISLLTYGNKLNNTTNNQGDHCIFAIADENEVIDEFNQVIVNGDVCAKSFSVIKTDQLFQSIITDLFEDTYKVSGDIEKEQSEVLKLERDFHMIMTGVFEHEMKRLESIYGTNHPRTRSIKAKLTHNINMFRHFDVELQIAAIKEPEIESNEMLIHGRLTDKYLLGIKGITIFLTDRRGKILTQLGTPETDASGYYSFLIFADEINKMKKKKVYLTICDARGKTLYRQHEPIEISKPEKKYVDIKLDREILSPVKKIEPIIKKEKIVNEKIKIVEEETIKKESEIKRIEIVKKEEEKASEKIKAAPPIKLEDIKGIGEASAKKLRDAGIKDAKTFSESDDEKLKEILGKKDIGKLKKESLSLLKKQEKDTPKKAKE